MAIWLFRAGKFGEYEHKFLTDNKIYLTWEGVKVDLSKFNSKMDLYKKLGEIYPEEKMGAIRNYTGQLWPIAKEFQKGDWIVLPSKFKSSIHIGEIIGDYDFDPKAENPFYHSLKVKWIAKDVPRSNFDQDLLYSFGAFMTVCQISRNDAEARIRRMAKNNWKSDLESRIGKEEAKEEELQAVISDERRNLEEYANDLIAKYIIRKFKGHGMAKVVDAILRAKGYFTHMSPEGPDKGIDILAAPEPFGFGTPRICVQVKTSDTKLDRMTLDQLIGAMQNFRAEQGLLVSWYGFKDSVEKEKPSQFFRVRLWEQKEIIQELLLNYEKLDDEIKAEIPLKKIWTLSIPESE